MNLNKKSPDILVVGAGIIGCSIAYRSAEAGLRVTVVERREPCRESSWAAAGMLAPFAEMAHNVAEPLYNLMSASLSMYPAFIEHVADEAGAVVDARGKVHGVEGLMVIDASIMPTIPAANVHLPTIMVAERCAAWL